MARPKKIKKLEEEVLEDTVTVEPTGIIEVEIASIAPLAQEFGNGDDNILRDKINEIISKI